MTLKAATLQPRLVLDGGYGEGGGQILRTALALSTLTGRPFELVNIRANRPKPGLAAQHLTAVRAAAALCDAAIEGDQLHSSALSFRPREPVRSGNYLFDVTEARVGGSAGSVTLVLHTVLLPLALASGHSTLTIRGGTHVSWSPSVDYVQDVWLPTLTDMGVRAGVELLRWGWYPAGGGEIRVRIQGLSGFPLAPIMCSKRGELRHMRGRAVAANLPAQAHIPERMSERARTLLRESNISGEIRAEQVDAVSSGAGIFLVAEYTAGRGGGEALGERGKPAEVVAEEAVAALLAYHNSGAAFDVHLGDQLILPAALSSEESRFSVERVTRHLMTNGWVVERFGVAQIAVVGAEGEPGHVTVVPVK
jgi:RNA 3'-terminal phosphate cyclase (ATP)